MSSSQWEECTSSSSFIITLVQTTIASLLVAVLFLAAYIYVKRRWVKRQLEASMPTVLWAPRFINYTSQDDRSTDDVSLNDLLRGGDQPIKQRKMSSSSITNILPKMERLNGPYGMYATVYGLTKVVHVGHPVPAREILNGLGKCEDVNSKRGLFNRLPCFKRSNIKAQKQLRRSSSLINTTGSTKTPAYDHFKNFSGDGVFTADGMDWKAKRASVLHCLLGNIDELECEVNKSADGLLEEIKSLSESEAAINVVTLLQRCTIGLIYKIITHDHDAFGPNGGEEKEVTPNNIIRSPSPTTSTASLDSIIESPNLATTTEAILNSDSLPEQPCSHESKTKQGRSIKFLLPTYLESVTQIRMIILAQSRSIWYLLPRWVYRLFSPMYREEERVMGPIRQFAQLTCENAKKDSPLNLLSKKTSHNSNTAINGGVSKDLLDEAVTLLFAGQDTSAATLSWTLHLLSLDPLKQQRLVKEVRSVLENIDSGNEMDFVSKAMIGKMPYLDAVIKESMRLYPVAPFVVRKLTTDLTIVRESQSNDESAIPYTKADTVIPSSTFACIWIYALHRNPKLWHSPEEFIPERWIDLKLRKKDVGQDEPGAYIPFAMGPRNCLGRPMAQIILRVLLARILSRYTVVDPRYEALTARQASYADKVPEKCLRKDMQAGFTVLPSNGLMLKFIRM